MTTAKTPLLRLRTLLILMAVLTGLTWWIGTSVERYTVQTSVIAADFPGPLSQWKLVENWKRVEQLEGIALLADGIEVHRDDKGISDAELRLPLPPLAERPPGSKIFASAMLSTREVGGGEKNWHGLLYTIWFYDRDGERIKNTARTVQALRGSTPLLRYSREIELPDAAASIGLALRVYESYGTAVLRQPQVQVVAPWGGYSQVMLGVLAAWVVFALLVVVSMLSHGNLLVALTPIALVGVIAVGVSLPGEMLHALTAPLERLVRTVWPELASVTSIQKLGHAVTFALLSFCACLVRARLGASWPGLIAFVLLLAALTEGVQLFFGGRNTRLLDIGIDLAGAALGLALFAVFWLLSAPLRRRGQQGSH